MKTFQWLLKIGLFVLLSIKIPPFAFACRKIKNLLRTFKEKTIFGTLYTGLFSFVCLNRAKLEELSWLNNNK